MRDFPDPFDLELWLDLWELWEFCEAEDFTPLRDLHVEELDFDFEED